MRRFLRDPIWGFLAIGLLIAWLAGLGEADGPDRRIVVGDADVDRIAAQWQAQMGRAPTSGELASLIDRFIREEVYFREALARGLDEGDIIVRRRMVQKLEFLLATASDAALPDDEVLLNHYRAQPQRYRQPRRISFRHRYFSDARRADARADAQAARGDPDADGDPFMLQRAYAERSLDDIADLFGAAFADELARAQPGDAWIGPLRSSFGWHLVRVEAVVEASVPPFAEVRRQVLDDWLATRSRRAGEDRYRELLARYEVQRP